MDPSDKSFAMGVMGSVFAIFGKFFFIQNSFLKIKYLQKPPPLAFIPYPLIFGAIIDSTCMIWEKSCGKTGNCWLYDLDKFRVYLHASSFMFLMVGVLCECGTIIYASRVRNIYEEDEEIEMKTVNNGNQPPESKNKLLEPESHDPSNNQNTET